jgi:hypothetical protein
MNMDNLLSRKLGGVGLWLTKLKILALAVEHVLLSAQLAV